MMFELIWNYGRISSYYFGLFVFVIILAVTSCLTRSASAETVVTAAQVNGTWSTGGTYASTFKVLALGNQKLKVEFFGQYYYESGWGPTVNTGEASGIAIIKGDTAIFKPDEDFEECIIIMKFTGGKLIVEQDHMCPFGFNVSAADTYRKVSKKKPKFKE